MFQEQQVKFESIEREKDEQCLLVEKLKQAAKDREVEFQISNKKTSHLVSASTINAYLFQLTHTSWMHCTPMYVIKLSN